MTKSYPKSGVAAPQAEDWAEQQARHTVLKIVVIVLGVIMAVLAIVVLSTLMLRVVKPRSDPAAVGVGLPDAPSPLKANLPAGARILSSSVGDGRIVIVYELDGRSMALVLDARTLAILGRIEPAAP